MLNPNLTMIFNKIQDDLFEFSGNSLKFASQYCEANFNEFAGNSNRASCVLLKIIVRFEFSTHDYPLVNFNWKPRSESYSAPSITFWLNFIENGGQISQIWKNVDWYEALGLSLGLGACLDKSWIPKTLKSLRNFRILRMFKNLRNL